jgi:alcohol dehydrogenase class IV
LAILNPQVISLRFEFATSGQILFGRGTVSEVPEIARTFGKQPFVLHDMSGLVTPLLAKLKSVGLSPREWPVQGEPSAKSVAEALQTAKDENCDLVISIGGGSTIDTGKATAVLLTNPGNMLDYIEVIGKGLKFQNPSVPFIAIPTTAGTGSEVTRNAVITLPDQHLKVSLRSPHLLPRVAAVDPELTYTLPPDITANTGLDALTQLIEPFVCNAPTPLTDAICRDGIPRAARALLQAYRNGMNAAAREDMSLASLFGGMSLANARLGAVHGLASPLGGYLKAPHGAICARLLPIVMEINIKSLQSNQPDSPSLERFHEVAHLLTGSGDATPCDGVKWIWNLCVDMKIRPLGDYGLKSNDFPELVIQAQKASSMKGNSVILSDREITEILEKAI